ncbi:hypothetical protein BH24ACT15_BH24ACT15_15020 [soil metagenome]
MRPRMRLLAERLGRAQEQGTVRSDVDVDHMVASLIGTLMFFVLTGGIDDHPPGLPERITDQILHGILVRRE